MDYTSEPTKKPTTNNIDDYFSMDYTGKRTRDIIDHMDLSNRRMATKSSSNTKYGNKSRPRTSRHQEERVASNNNEVEEEFGRKESRRTSDVETDVPMVEFGRPMKRRLRQRTDS